MRKKIMLIGSDSFIARYFAAEKGAGYEIRGASLAPSRLGNELVMDDLFKLSAADFEGVSSAVNFAAIVHRPEISDPDIYDRVNCQLPLHLARVAADGGVDHFIQMSTIAVYGGADRISPSTPAVPESPYGSSKLKADLELLKMRRDDFRIALLRPSMVYGGGASPGNMMRLIGLCDRPVPLPFRGVDNWRQFAYAGLVADALDRIIEKRVDGIFLLADRRPVSTEELVGIIRSKLGKSQMQFRLPALARRFIQRARPSLYRRLFGSLLIDSDRTYRQLGLKERKGDLEKGIAEMVECYRLL
ncbi:MAG: NAD-dependent epimerase/dehydratase family protein [Candidatus Latescibacteria bacterium]|nr:NAD-dependent epimerase/dehydratase family protein [bacterium]MBD3423612.1 NAD-dependent epimerase/dehydratase family protein [Candidatus Latescibacterota bacterium]